MCAEPDKTCPSSSASVVCSGHGQCVFKDSANAVIPSCGVTNVLCSASCVCDSDSQNQPYGGSDCSLDPSAALVRDTLRFQLCSAINSVYAAQGLSCSINYIEKPYDVV